MYGTVNVHEFLYSMFMTSEWGMGALIKKGALMRMGALIDKNAFKGGRLLEGGH